MPRFLLMIPVALAAFLAIEIPAGCAEELGFQSLSRAEIKEIPILDRPHHRRGHFYGNTVRRRYSRGVSRGYDEAGTPTTPLARMMEERM